MNHQPTVSVLLPVYNGMPYLRNTVESVLAQTLKDFQLVIIDDGSTDNTGNYILSLTDTRIKYHRQNNAGTGAAANAGLALINSKYTARIDGDDIALPDRLEKQVSFLDNNPETSMVGSQFMYFTTDTNRAGFPSHLPLKHEDIVRALLKMQHGFCNPSLCYRTEDAKTAGGYQANLPFEDIPFMTKMAAAYNVANLNEVLIYYRVHKTSANANSALMIRPSHRHAIDCYHAVKDCRICSTPEDYFNSNPRTPAQRCADNIDLLAYTHYRNALVNHINGRKVAAFLQFAISCILSPSRCFNYIKKITGSSSNTTT